MNLEVNPSYGTQKEKYDKILKNFKNSGAILNQSRRNTIKIFEINEEKVNVKSFKVPNLLNKIAYRYFRKSKAQRSFENASYLLKNKIGTPTPIAFAEQPGLVFKESYYICKQITYDLTFRELIHDLNFPQREFILRAFTRFTFKLHENNVNFLDHSPGNTLIQKKEDHYDFFLVDLNRMEFKKMNFDDRMKNFHRITPDKEMAKIIANEYAKLIPQTEEETFSRLWGYIQRFQEKAKKKKEWKRRLGR